LLPTVNFLAILSKGLGFDLENLDDEIKVLIWHDSVSANPYPCNIISDWLSLSM
jgi:hypothetical protein